MQNMQNKENGDWISVCPLSDLVKNRGICALLADQQVAIFLVEDKLYAVGNFDPFSKANVISRGIVGDIDNELVVASPIYKQHFSLTTGKCIEEPEQALPLYQAKIIDGWVCLETK